MIENVLLERAGIDYLEYILCNNQAWKYLFQKASKIICENVRKYIINDLINLIIISIQNLLKI